MPPAYEVAPPGAVPTESSGTMARPPSAPALRRPKTRSSPLAEIAPTYAYFPSLRQTASVPAVTPHASLGESPTSHRPTPASHGGFGASRQIASAPPPIAPHISLGDSPTYGSDPSADLDAVPPLDAERSYGDMLATWAMQCHEATSSEAGRPSENSLLQLNKATGKVELEPPTFRSREVSFNTLSIRRQISFILDESLEECRSPSMRVAAAC